MSDEQSDERSGDEQSEDEQEPDEEQQSDDEQAARSDDEEQSDEDEQSDEPESDSQRFEQLDQGIDSARKTAEDADVLIDPDEPRYVESGEDEDQDDQTITPPA
ncbi:MAG: hypothetical protein M3N25_07255 [Actinomycetota bacterium]|nr:hypothetical protein [Actinomycetota bacterium]